MTSRPPLPTRAQHHRGVSAAARRGTDRLGLGGPGLGGQGPAGQAAAGASSGRPGPGGSQRVDASMTLLIEVMKAPLDPGYAQAAQRKRQAGLPRESTGHRAGRWTLLTALALVLGIGIVTAITQLRIPESAAREARALLEQQIVERRAHMEAANIRIDSLTADISAIQDQVLMAANPELYQILNLDSLTNGSTAVTGPGLVVTLSDGTGGGLLEATADQWVRDSDIQMVVHALWAAGAEAIAVDDVRLTMTSAIRNAGPAILVDLLPLSGPTYVIRAIGDPDAMLQAWDRSVAPAYLDVLLDQWGITSSVVAQTSLDIPASSVHILRYADAVDSAVVGKQEAEEAGRRDALFDALVDGVGDGLGDGLAGEVAQESGGPAGQGAASGQGEVSPVPDNNSSDSDPNE